MLVFDYLTYVARIKGVMDDGPIRDIAGLCGINEVMHKNVSELSKGYKQRVGLAHAMIHDPEYLILDEPTSGLDPNQIIEIRNLIKEIGKSKTVILSTHILSEVEATCNRVIIIDRGKIVADGSTADIKSSFGRETRIYIKMGGADSGTVAGELRKIGGVTAVSDAPGNEEGLSSLVLQSPGDRDVRPDVFHLAGEKGWVLYEMRRESRTLEHVFRELTRGGGHEE
jgi:ABC-2 type transport system ATP-binding protein